MRGDAMERILSISATLAIFLTLISVPCYSSDDPQTLTFESIKLYNEGKYREAIPLAERSMAIFEKSVGPQHPAVASVAGLLARLYLSIGEDAKAEKLCKRALFIQEKVASSQPQGIITTLELLSEVYIAKWELSAAEPLLQRALAINEKAFGSQNPGLGIILNDLGVLYVKMTRYEKGEECFQRALSVNEKALGPTHFEVTTNLQNLAELYCQLGFYAKAEPLIQRAIALREKQLGPDHPAVAGSLVILAGIYQSTGLYAKAQPLIQRAVAITESKLGPWHPVVANNLHNLGLSYYGIGDYAKAETFYLRALKIRERSLGPNHPDLALTQNNLALLYIRTGEAAKAEPLYRQALAIDEKVLGPDHPEVALVLHNLATSLAAQNKPDQALPLMQRELYIENELMDQVMGFTSEIQKLEFLAKQRSNLDIFLTLAATLSRTDNNAKDSAFAVWLKRKGAALEAQRQFQQALVLSGDPKGKAVFERLSQLCAEVTKLTFTGPGQGDVEKYQARLSKLKNDQAILEAELAKLSRNYARERNRTKADVKTVAAALPKGSALVDFAKINIFDFNAKGNAKQWKPPHYIVFVLPAGFPDRLTLVDLGEAEPIEQAVSSLRTALHDTQDAETIDKSAHTLQELVFTPLAAGLGEAKNIFISPDGVLNLIPFEILRDSQNQPLIDTYTFNYVCSGRDLIGMGETPTATGPALVLGDPDFDLSAQGIKEAAKRLAQPGKATQAFERSADLRAITLSPLPATRAEATAVAGKMGGDIRLRLGAEAVEGELYLGPAPRYLHLATHGFFLSDQEMQEAMDSRGLTDLSSFNSFPRAASTTPLHYEDPLARSAVALAGANATLKGKGVDGIVTAEKFLSLPINGTEVVVLSACQTGLGDVQTGEGVFGLRRAITQAGAKGMVMSMWSVPDQETRELMENFYDNLAKGLPKAQALRQAALKERDITTARFNSDNPIYWGAFIYLGER